MRSRLIHNVDECVNPLYHSACGNAVSVKDAINHVFRQIHRSAQKISSNYSYANIYFPPLRASLNICQYIQNIKLQLVIWTNNNPEWKITVIDCGKTISDDRRDIHVSYGTMETDLSKHCFPIAWHDNERDWTWCDVVEHPEYFSSSSTDVWPPEEYKKRAQQCRAVNGELATGAKS